MWLTDEKGQSSTYRELTVIYYVNYSYAKELENKKVKVLMDNDNEDKIVLLVVPNHIFKHEQSSKLFLAKHIVVHTFCS